MKVIITFEFWHNRKGWEPCHSRKEDHTVGSALKVIEAAESNGATLRFITRVYPD